MSRFNGSYLDKYDINGDLNKDSTKDDIDDLSDIDFSKLDYVDDYHDSLLHDSFEFSKCSEICAIYPKNFHRENFNFGQFMHDIFSDMQNLDPVIVEYVNDAKYKLYETYRSAYEEPLKSYESILNDKCDKDTVIDYVYNQYQTVRNRIYTLGFPPEGYHRYVAGSDKYHITRDDFIKYYIDTGKYKHMIEKPDNHKYFYTKYVDELRDRVISHVLDRENFNIYENMNPRLLDFFYKLTSSKGYTVFINNQYKKIRSRKHLDMILESGDRIYIRKKSEIHRENIENRHKKLSRRERKRLNLKKIKEEA